MTEITNLEGLFALHDEYKKKIKEHGEDFLKQEFRQFFESTPEIESIRWTQYTPSFNDGDPCEFSLGEVMYRTPQNAAINNAEAEPEEGADDEDWEGEYGEGYNGCYWYGGVSDVAAETQEKLRKFEKLLGNAQDILKVIFGDGVQVTATKESIDTEDYDSEY